MSVSRYKVLARRNKYESWTAWTDTSNYQRAKEHAAKAEGLGYLAKIISFDKEKQTYDTTRISITRPQESTD